MEDMDSYFRKWREWRNGDLGSNSSMCIKKAEKDEERTSTQLIKPINNLTNRINVNLLQQILAFQYAFFDSHNPGVSR